MGEKSGWRREFRQLGTEDVRKRAAYPAWSGEKVQYARQWLWWQEHRLQVIEMGVAAAIGATAIVVKLLK